MLVKQSCEQACHFIHKENSGHHFAEKKDKLSFHTGVQKTKSATGKKIIPITFYQVKWSIVPADN